MSNILESVQRIAATAPMPEKLPRIIQILRDPNANAALVEEFVRHDASLTANILKLCNSVTYRGAEPAASVDEALLRLGFNPVLEMALVLISKDIYRLPAAAETHLAGLWNHALLTAILSRRLVRSQPDRATAAFTAGLLHDFGKALLMKADSREYCQVIDQARHFHKPLIDQEEAVFQTNHATVAGEILGRWNLPAVVVKGVWFHHHPALSGGASPIARAVELADTLTYTVGFGLTDQYARCRNASTILTELQVEAQDVPGLLDEALREAQAVRDTLG